VVEASRLDKPTPMLKTEWIKQGAFVVPYGTMSAIELSLTDVMTKPVVDDWGQCKGGKFGSLRAHVEAGKLSETTLHAEFGQIVPASSPVAKVKLKLICFGIAGCLYLTLRSDMLCWRRPSASGLSNACGLPKRRNRRTCALLPTRECTRSIPRLQQLGKSYSAGLRIQAA
jgi:hypothetical protein